jgi:hypothetical protein
MHDIGAITHAIKVLVEKGDHATKKAEQFYVSAGQHLKTLRDTASSKAEWARLINEKCDLGISRAYELIQIADGRTTVEKVRANTNRRKAKHRARPFRNGQTDDAPASLDPDTAASIRGLAHRLIQIDPKLARETQRLLGLGGAARLADEIGKLLERKVEAGNGRADPIPDSLHGVN